MNCNLKDNIPEKVLRDANFTLRLPVAVHGFVREKKYKTGPWAQQSSPSGAGTLLTGHTPSRMARPNGLPGCMAVKENEVQTGYKGVHNDCTTSDIRNLLSAFGQVITSHPLPKSKACVLGQSKRFRGTSSPFPGAFSNFGRNSMDVNYAYRRPL